jgi:hypothetical protein
VTGDIVLIEKASAGKKKETANVIGQRFVTQDFSTGPYTHAALILGTYRVVHAIPAPDHIEFTVIQELLAPQEKWVVWRHRVLAERLGADTKLRYAFLWYAELHVGERYNYPVPPKSRTNHSFCSELIGKVYARFGFPFDPVPERLMPIAIAKAVRDHPDWGEVTDEYQRALAADARYRQLYDPEETRAALMHLRALTDAKEAAKEYAALAEPIEGLRRFDRWNVEKGTGGWQLWTPNAPRERRAMSKETLEWLSLLLLDKLDVELIDFYGSLGNIANPDTTA